MVREQYFIEKLIERIDEALLKLDAYYNYRS